MTILENCYVANQSWYYEWVGIHERKFKVSIRRNAYDEQSWARGFVYDPVGSKWNQIVNNHIKECDCQSVSYDNPHIGRNDFLNDRVRLLEQMLKICL